MSKAAKKLGQKFDSEGFVVIRSLISSRKISEVTAAYDRLMRRSQVSDYFGPKGSRCLKDYLGLEPEMDVLVDHPDILSVTASIDGLPALYTGAGALWYMLDDVPWHCDGRPGRTGMPIKVSLYLDVLTKECGAFRLLPGSHIPSRSMQLMKEFGVWTDNRPRIHPDIPRPLSGEVVVETEPGDVVFWDNRIWHSAPRRLDGLGRRAIFVNYIRDPRDDKSAARDLRDDVADTLRNRTRQFIYPRQMATEVNWPRQRTIQRLLELKVPGVIETNPTPSD